MNSAHRRNRIYPSSRQPLRGVPWVVTKGTFAMCSHKHDSTRQDVELHDRRDVLKLAAALVAAPLAGTVASASQSAPVRDDIGAGPVTVRGYGFASATSRMAPLQIERRALGPRDVLLDVLYAGVCHSDIHIVHRDWRPAKYPIVPGHEIIGRVRAVGSAVTKFQVDDIGGVGCMVDSCGSCENCLADREQNCLNGATFTYDSDDRTHGGYTFGGYSEKVVVTDRFVIRIPPGADLAAT